MSFWRVMDLVGLTEIEESAFAECESLASVTIPGGVTKIGYCAFADCTSLASVTIPASVTEIGWNAFENCTSLKEVNFPGTMAQWQSLDVSLYRGAVVHCTDGDLAKR